MIHQFSQIGIVFDFELTIDMSSLFVIFLGVVTFSAALNIKGREFCLAAAYRCMVNQQVHLIATN